MKLPKIYIWNNESRQYIGEGRGVHKDASIQFEDGLLQIESTHAPIRKIELVWEHKPAEGAKILGDHWERGYGDLAWRNPEDTSIMPWYFMEWTGETLVCFGVKTQPNALCGWKLEEDTVALVADISSGKSAVQLDGRVLRVCEVVMETFRGDCFESAQKFCKMMCDSPRLPPRNIYGGNDWYCNYGNNSYEKIVQHTRRIVACSPLSREKPYMVIDDGWELCHHPKSKDEEHFNGGPWQYCNRNFGDMKKLADEITALGAIPGIWFRPLLTTEKIPDAYVLKYRETKYTLDPSVPEVLQIIKEDVRCLRKWGYRLIKHDFTSYDIFGRWGFEAGFPEMDVDFADRTRTTAEIIKNLYQAIRDAAGEDMIIIGCNTMSHLAAGLFEIQRTGDDTSGTDWERTKKMGINTLAFRMCQHNRFYQCDADCVGITNEIPWESNRKWLDVLAKSGTPLFVSIGEDAFTEQVKADITNAFALAADNTVPSKPLDWTEESIPHKWESRFGVTEYVWDDLSP